MDQDSHNTREITEVAVLMMERILLLFYFPPKANNRTWNGRASMLTAAPPICIIFHLQSPVQSLIEERLRKREHESHNAKEIAEAAALIKERI